LLAVPGPAGPAHRRPSHRAAASPAPPHPGQTLRRIHLDRVQPLLSPPWSRPGGEPGAAGPLAPMAIQAGCLRTVLLLLADRLVGEARRVVLEVAERHEVAVDFFTAEARERILRSRREAVTARLLLALGSPLEGGGVPDPDLRAALAVLGATAADRAALRRAR